MNSKTFNELKRGDKIYAVVTDLPKLSIAELLIINIENKKRYDYELLVTTVPMKEVDPKTKVTKLYTNETDKEKCCICRGIYWHTNEEAARNTIKETIEYRIKKKERIIRESKRALENYKRELEEYEDC